MFRDLGECLRTSILHAAQVAKNRKKQDVCDKKGNDCLGYSSHQSNLDNCYSEHQTRYNICDDGNESSQKLHRNLKVSTCHEGIKKTNCCLNNTMESNYEYNHRILNCNLSPTYSDEEC